MISVWDNGFSGRGVLMQRRKMGRKMERGEWVFISHPTCYPTCSKVP